jgi:hypothetical protein
MSYQLPDDVISMGYRQTKPYCWEQLFYSPKHDFLGTEKDFIAAGYGYAYQQAGEYKRIIINV